MRNYKRKTERGFKPLHLYTEAAKLVLTEGKSIRGIAKQLDLCHATLFKIIKKQKQGIDVKVGYVPSRRVFNDEEENNITNYLIHCSRIYFGLLPAEVKKLAYDCAVKFNVKNIPNSWHNHKCAGPDWLTSFLKRNPQLSIRKPEATSISRAMSFNQHDVGDFFLKLGAIMLKHELPPSRIWNLDETGVTTVQKPKKIVAEKGIKQIGAITSGERGTLVTVEMAVSASGNSIPPMFIFPRLKYSRMFVSNGPAECIGAGNSSGWMTAVEFLTYMDHFIKYVKPTEHEPVLLLLDNHSSHIDLEVVIKAKENHIILLSFPPHCTHRLQPLNVGVYGPFKSYCASAQDNWLRNNPGKCMTIYDIPAIVKHAWPLASTPKNIMNGFAKTGICPYNANIFQDKDFAPSLVTDRPPPDEIQMSSQVASTSSQVNIELTNEPGAGSQDQVNVFQVAASSSQFEAESNYVFSPELVRPYPKAPAKKIGLSKRRIRKSAVLTDTPEKDALAMEQANRRSKKQKTVKGKGKGKGKQKTSVKKKIFVEEKEESSESEDECVCLNCYESFSKSKPGEEWVQCTSCKNWSHERCIKSNNNIHNFVCSNCFSDISSESE